MSCEGPRSETSRVTQTHDRHVPPSVEAVIGFGFSPDLVFSTYRQLLAGAGFSVDAVWHRRDVAAEDSSQGHVSAAALLVAVENAIRQSSFSSTRVDDGVTLSDFAAAPFGSTNTEPRQAEAAAATPNVEARDVERSDDIQDDSDLAQLAENSATYWPRHSLTRNVEATTTRSTGQSAYNDPTPNTSTDVTVVVAAGSFATSYTTSGTTAPVESTNGLSTSDETTTATTAVSPSRNGTSVAMTMTSASPSGVGPPGQDTATSQNSDSGTKSCDHSRASRRDSALSEDKARERRHQLERLRALRAENRRLKARQMCRQCHLRPVALTLLPCGHFCFCQECASSFHACPVCRKTILADVRTFVS